MGDRKSRSLFDKPLTGDWVFWVYGLFILIYSFGSFNDFYAGTSLSSLSSAGLLAAFIDLVIFPFLGALIFPTSLILIARRIARRIARSRSDRHETAVVDGDRSEGNGLESNESGGFRAKLPTLTKKQAFVTGATAVLLFVSVQVSEKYDLPKLFANFQGAPTASENKAVPESGVVKRAPTEVTPSAATPEVSPTKSATKSATPKPTKTPSPSKSAAPKPEPTPVASWWPAHFSPWGNTIAYKYAHSNAGCTNTEPSWQCQGRHYIEFIVTEPCTAFSVEITDESGESYTAYFERYLPTGQIFSDDTIDSTPQSPGRVTNITC